MSRPTAASLAWSLCAVDVLLAAAAAILAVLAAETAERQEIGWGSAVLVGWLAFPLVGALVASRRAGGPVGWICLGVGLAIGAGAVTDRYSAYALETNPGVLPGGSYAAWFNSSSWVFFIGLIGVFLIVFFPDGKLPSVRWRPVPWVAGAAMTAAWLGIALTPGRMEDPPPVPIENPLGIEGAKSALAVVAWTGILSLFACIVAAAVSIVVRYRRSRGAQRQQLKWFVTAAVVTVAIFFLGWPAGVASRTLEDTVNSLGLVAWALLPLAVGIAVLRYRLYDVDVVINRTLVYATLTALLAGTYLGLVLLFQLVLAPVTEGNELAVAGSTLAVAALFRPARRRVQAAVDRRFYRRKYDAERTLAAFSVRLRDQVELEALAADLRGVVRETVQPAHVSLWLREAER